MAFMLGLAIMHLAQPEVDVAIVDSREPVAEGFAVIENLYEAKWDPSSEPRRKGDSLGAEAEAIDTEFQCAMRKALRSCLNQFSQAHQELLLAPYAGDGRVRALAEGSGKSANALYKLLGRLRGKLSDCIKRDPNLQEL